MKAWSTSKCLKSQSSLHAIAMNVLDVVGAVGKKSRRNQLLWLKHLATSGAPPLDLDSFAGESMRGAIWSVDTTTKEPGFNLQNTACFRWNSEELCSMYLRPFRATRKLFERSEFLIDTPHKKNLRVCPRARVK